MYIVIKNYDVLVQKYFTDGAESIYWFHTTPYFVPNLALWFLGPRNNEATIHHELHVGCATCLGTCGWLSEVEESKQPSESMTPSTKQPIKNPARWTPSPFIIRVKITPKLISPQLLHLFWAIFRGL